MRDPASVESTDHCQRARQDMAQHFMVLAKQRQQQRSIDDDLLWTNEINGQRCFEHADANVPEFMRIVLSEGLNQNCSTTSAQAAAKSLSIQQSADEQNPFSAANAPMSETMEMTLPEFNGSPWH